MEREHNIWVNVNRAPPSALKMSQEEKRVITKTMAEFIVIDSQPFSVVEAKGFRRVVNKLNPLYQCPSTTIEVEVGEICSQIEHNVREQIKKLKWLTITVDGWTSKGMDSYLMVTGHWLDDNFEVRQCCLSVRPMKVAHNSQNLRSTVSLTFFFFFPLDRCFHHLFRLMMF